MEHMKTSLFKVQVAFNREYDRSEFADIDALSYSKRGSVANLIVRGDAEETRQRLLAKGPILCDMLPLTLEEVFIYEMQSLGYDFQEVLEGMSYE